MTEENLEKKDPKDGGTDGEGAKAPEKTFTQTDLDRIVGERLARQKKELPNDDELKGYREWKKTQQTEAEKAAETQKKLEALTVEAEELRLLERGGKLNRLQLQVEFVIARAFRSAADGEKFRAVIYVADFVYFEVESGRFVVEDTKGIETTTFKNKWRQCRELYPEFDWRILKRKDV